MKTANRGARRFVQNRQSFSANNLYGIAIGNRYTVFSYGDHWPLFYYDGSTWYGNRDKYSVTTSRHYSQARPQADITEVSADTMRALVRGERAA